ncbi:hypothetical protein AB0D86_44390 [Streptomyces sp. NPDC048324]|uniref:hypothetical protein n=1 Tax=Streptomyces sp. NPDC048324 TaxID=3157205 RepID=UPI0034488F57
MNRSARARIGVAAIGFVCVVEADLRRHLLGVHEVFALEDESGRASALQPGAIHQPVGELAKVVVVRGRLRQAAGLLPPGATGEAQGKAFGLDTGMGLTR